MPLQIEWRRLNRSLSLPGSQASICRIFSGQVASQSWHRSGISLDVKEKMFNPFFTTKPAGEGAGLGLSISHDIIAKQHDGSIEVDTKPGQYTECRSVLPRKAAIFANAGASA